MPTWSQVELERAFPLCYNFDFADCYEWYVKYGGSIMLILNKDDDDYIEEALLFQQVFYNGYFMEGPAYIDTNYNYVTLHLNPKLLPPLPAVPVSQTVGPASGNELSVTLPALESVPVSGDGSDNAMTETATTLVESDATYDYDSQIYTFASDYIYQKVERRWRNDLHNIAEKFNQGILYEYTSEGTLFEKLCLYTFPMTGKTLRMTGLSFPTPVTNLTILSGLSYPTPDTATRDLTIPGESDSLPYHWDSAATLRQNVYYRPQISNLECGHAFVLDSQGDLYVFQMTVADTHPLKANGLATIVQAYLTSGLPIASKNLVFVTPIAGKLSTAQPLVIKENDVVGGTHIPEHARGFKQWKIVYELTL